MQVLIDLGVANTESLPIGNREATLKELIARLEQTIDILNQALPESFEGKENMTVDVHLGTFSIDCDAMRYVHEISVPSL